MTQPFKHPTREAWLAAAAELMREKAALRPEQLPRVSVGFPSRGALSKSNKRIGECWPATCSDDNRAHVFVSPLEGKGERVLDILLHELGHVKHPEAGHGKPFKQFMKLVGLEGKATATVASPQLSLWLKSLIDKELGPYPHSALKHVPKGKKQTTRLLKATCPACECTVRITAKWCGEGGETLPFCGYCGIPGEPQTFERMKLEEPKE